MSNYQDYDGYRYAVMTDTPKSDTNYQQSQLSYIAMPAGWSLVPYSADIASNVVTDPNTNIEQWGTVCLVFSNGASYRTNNGGSCSSSNVLGTSGSSYKAYGCYYKVLIRRPL